MDPATIIAIAGVASKLLNLGIDYAKEAKKRKELTPDQEAELERIALEMFNQPQWKDKSDKSASSEDVSSTVKSSVEELVRLSSKL